MDGEHFHLEIWIDGHAINHHGIQMLCFVPDSIYPSYIFQSSFHLHRMQTLSRYWVNMQSSHDIHQEFLEILLQGSFFHIISEVSRRHGLTYSPKVQNFCIITYNLFTRLVGIVPNEGLACFVMTVKDDRRSTNNICFLVACRWPYSCC